QALELRRAIYPGDFDAAAFEELNRERPDTAGGTVDENLLPGSQLANRANRLHGQLGRVRDRSRLLERDRWRLSAEMPGLHADVLGEAAEAITAQVPIDLVADDEIADVTADGLDASGDVAAHDAE